MPRSRQWESLIVSQCESHTYQFSLLILFLCQKILLPSLSSKLFFFSVLLLYFDIILDLNINCKMSTKNSQIPFTQNPQMLTFYHICVIILPSLFLSFASNTIFFWITWESVSDMMSFYCKYFRLYSLKRQGHSLTQGLPDDSLVKKLPTNAGNIRDEHFISGSGRSPRGGNGNPHLDSCQDNPTDRGAWWAIVHVVTTNRMWLSTHILLHNYNTNIMDCGVWGPNPEKKKKNQKKQLHSSVIKSSFIWILPIVPIISFMAKESPRSHIEFIMYHVSFIFL